MPAPVTVIDQLLDGTQQASVWAFLNRPGWAYGGYSEEGGDRYFFKHFAGFRASGKEARTAAEIEDELVSNAPVIAQMWQALRSGPLRGNALARCYANGMPPGAEGAVHVDSDVASHLTAIYYAHPTWNANLGGETLMFNPAGDEVVAAVYPKPNRLVVFSGVMPHVARPISRRCLEMRITLMFKMMPEGDSA